MYNGVVHSSDLLCKYSVTIHGKECKRHHQDHSTFLDLVFTCKGRWSAIACRKFSCDTQHSKSGSWSHFQNCYKTKAHLVAPCSVDAIMLKSCGHDSHLQTLSTRKARARSNYRRVETTGRNERLYHRVFFQLQQ